MEQVRFYLDEHIPAAVAEGLRRRGVDSLTVQQAGRSGWSDPEQLAFARTAGRVIVTMDSDFLVLASQGRSFNLRHGCWQVVESFFEALPFVRVAYPLDVDTDSLELLTAFMMESMFGGKQ